MEQNTEPRKAIAIALTPVEGSSQIAAIGYDEPSETLAVQFSDTPARAYHYHGFKAGTWDAFRDAPSKGGFFYAHIKGHYAFDRVEEDGTVSKSVPAPTVELVSGAFQSPQTEPEAA